MKKLVILVLMCLVAPSSWAFGSFKKSNSAVPTARISSPDSIVPAIPEPETYLLMLAGLGVVVWVARSRKKK
jgi:hypothetical protein